jgi:AcrR family transcriptional regulator
MLAPASAAWAILVHRQSALQIKDMTLSPAVPLAEDDSSKRRQILDGAHKVFMDLGFDGASMGEIARAAGVSKGTLYVYFADKSQLFGAVVEREAIEQGQIKFDLNPGRDAETTLRQFGQAYIEILCRPQGGSAIRTVMAIAERMPDVGRQYYEHVIDRTTRELAAWLDSEVEAKRLSIDDTALAAQQFMLSCQAKLFLPFILQVAPSPSRAQIAKVVASATKMFLAAYRR